MNNPPCSVGDVTNSSGALQAQYAYDPYGRATPLQGSVSSDFQYAGYYFHAPSGLFLTLSRAYSASLGRFINRDRIGEAGGTNLYSYVDNQPVRFTDPSGFDGKDPDSPPCITSLKDCLNWCNKTGKGNPIWKIQCYAGCLEKFGDMPPLRGDPEGEPNSNNRNPSWIPWWWPQISTPWGPIPLFPIPIPVGPVPVILGSAPVVPPAAP